MAVRDAHEHPVMPFAERLETLRRDRRWTFRRLAEQTRRVGKRTGRSGLSHPYLCRLERGEVDPPLATIELLADALGADPHDFAEYRLLKASAKLDWRQAGLDEALATLESGELEDRPAPAAAA